MAGVTTDHSRLPTEVKLPAEREFYCTNLRIRYGWEL